MTEKELHKLSRQDLLQLLLAQSREVARQKSAIEVLKADLTQEKELTEKLKEKLNDKDGTIEHLKHRLDDKDKALDHLKDEVAELESARDELRERLEDKDLALDIARAQLDRLAVGSSAVKVPDLQNREKLRKEEKRELLDTLRRLQEESAAILKNSGEHRDERNYN